MTNFGMNLVGTVVGLIGVGFLFKSFLRIYRRIPLLESFTSSEKRILIFQLLAMSLWVIFALGFFIYNLWSGFKFVIFTESPGNIVIAFMNWVFLGFVAATSLFPGVSVVSSTSNWLWRDPVKGRDSLFIGISMLALLFYWTWKIFLPSL
jgi:hypothetical protein